MIEGNAASTSGIPLFAGLGSAELAHLSEFMQCKVMRASSSLILEETPGEVLYLIKSGAIKIRVSDLEGTEVIFAILGPGDIVGEMSVVDSLQRSASAVTIEPTTVFAIDRSAFWKCLETMPTMTYNLVGIMSRRLRAADARIQSLATLDVDGRVASQILSLAWTYGESVGTGDIRIPFRLTQSDLAGLVGASRVRVNQVLATYRRCGMISVEYGYRVVVHDSVGLAARCQ